MKTINSDEFVIKAIDIAKTKTLYVRGGFGQLLNDYNKAKFINNSSYNEGRADMINKASSDTRAFDCVCFVKAILWGFPNTQYLKNGVPDIGENQMIKLCSNVSSDFKNIIPGAFLWMDGHCGIYIGNGLGVECTPKWKNGVQVTCVSNLGSKPGYNNRTWTKWGLLPYVDYEDDEMVNKLKVLVDGKIVEVDAINKNGTNYIRLRDFDDKLGIVKVDYDSVKKLPTITHS